MPPTDTTPEAPTPDDSEGVSTQKDGAKKDGAKKDGAKKDEAKGGGPAAPLPRGAAPGIRFEKVVKRFGQNVVLRELDFTVEPGERVTLIGPSGSGKTTILRLLMTLEKLDDGVIWIGDQTLWHMERNGKRVPAN